ncbi:NIL domain-containing protein [aff. Roholtiella sp. LEGE 12411]|uniref:NIL domain-containing protein n=1 Tax=aff. Roholtiella sp. LEGE 12411 TaxID=1828822 RepID=UPI0018803458|nr:NIL domain-containing protein [aff. Roholtiella sp. LEGE 12411]MBE9034570.1 NIL domain-containing protein [aff. Roholtiella sp. LEGE 12411]
MAITNKQVKFNTDILDNRRTQTRIQVYIPKGLHEQPVISRLVSHYGITVIIAAAQVSANVPECSCFELELRGTASQIESALTYLDELDLEVLHQSNSEEDGW